MSNLFYQGDTFRINMHRYSDPDRLNAARSAAVYLGKADRDNVRRPLRIIKDGHVPMVFRGEMAEFEFVDVSKEVYDHLITYSTLNMRVAGGNRALTSDSYTTPSDKVKEQYRVEGRIRMSMNNYEALLESGETPQVARAAMPIAAKLNPFILQFNLLSLMESVFPQRIWTKGAQGNTVKVVQGMWKLVHSADPDLWDIVYRHYGPEAQAWKLMLHRISKEDPKLIKELFKKYGQQTSMWE